PGGLGVALGCDGSDFDSHAAIPPPDPMAKRRAATSGREDLGLCALRVPLTTCQNIRNRTSFLQGCVRGVSPGLEGHTYTLRYTSLSAFFATTVPLVRPSQATEIQWFRTKLRLRVWP